MKRFYCQCGQEVSFQSLYCISCGRDLGYDPKIKTIWSGEIRQDGLFYAHVPKEQGFYLTYQYCSNRQSASNCNWLIQESDRPSDDSSGCQCVSCRTTRVIPDQSIERNLKRWQDLESAKRRLMNTLLSLGLVDVLPCGITSSLAFDFLEDKRTNPNVDLEFVLSGHNDGLITINAAEADEGFLHIMKEQMGERYRTLLGHFRHEIGHFFWDKIFTTETRKEAFRAVFGDERADYRAALDHYYEVGGKNHWRSRFITPYASSHPHEDWAETWAHYLHIVDTLETAESYGISSYEPDINDFDQWFNEWERVSKVMNALNQSMGLADAYPFVVSSVVEGKLRFIDEMLDQHRESALFLPKE